MPERMSSPSSRKSSCCSPHSKGMQEKGRAREKRQGGRTGPERGTRGERKKNEKAERKREEERQRREREGRRD